MRYRDEVDMGALLQLKKSIGHNSGSDTNSGNNSGVSVLPFCIKAISLALRDFPILNATYDDDDAITLKHEHNIGIAMDTPRGSVVPVIRNCQTKSMHEISAELQYLKELAQGNTGSTSSGTSGG
jgi:2-oxoisovalerate dehydrogenase E2 component (dihydrolipoyl transacylase)